MSDSTFNRLVRWRDIGDTYIAGDTEFSQDVIRLMDEHKDLLDALKMARECIAYCRKAHKDVQSGEGIPVEIFLDKAIAKATGETP